MERTPLHLQISDLILEDIQDGTYTDRLPNERDLAKHYKTSRTTIGRAIKKLVDRGIVFQKQGSGTYINSVFIEGMSDYSGYSFGPVGLSHTSSNAVFIKSVIHTFEVVRADEQTAARLQISEGGFVYHVLRSRHSKDGIISVEELFIPIAILPNLDETYFIDSFYETIRKRDQLQLSKSFFNITVVLPSEAHADILGIEPNNHVVRIDELVFQDNGQPFQISIVDMISNYFSYNGISEL